MESIKKVMFIAMILAGTTFAASTYDGNELADVFIATTGGSTMWYESNGSVDDLVFKASITSANLPNSVAVGQIAGSDIWTLAIGKGSATGAVVRLYKDDGVSTFSDAGAVWDIHITGSYTDRATKPNGLAMGNLSSTGTGNAGIVLDTNTTYIGAGTATGALEETYSSLASGYSVTSHFTDLDNDGNTDLFVSRANNPTGSTYYTAWYEYDPASENLVWNKNINDSDTLSTIDMASGDINGDGWQDMFNLQNDGSIVWSKGTTVGSTAIQQTTIDPLAANTNCLDVADIDNDGIEELLLGTDTDIRIFELSGETFSLKNTITVAGGVQDLTIAAIPEPATISLLCLGGVAALVKKRRL